MVKKRSRSDKYSFDEEDLENTTNLQGEAKSLPLVPVPLDRPPYLPLLIEQVKPVLKNWTYKRFKKIFFNGKLTDWVDVHFATTHVQQPFLCKKFVTENYTRLPMILMHAMYALALCSNSESREQYSPGDAHFTYCKLLYSEIEQPASPMEIIAVAFMGFYAALYTTAVVGGISYYNMATSFCIEAGIFRNKNYEWKLKDGTPIEKSVVKQMKQMITYVLYTSDFFASHLRHIPFDIDDNQIDFDLLNSTVDQPYNEFYDSELWMDHIELTKIGKISLQFFKGNDNKLRTKLNNKLNSWYTKFKPWGKRTKMSVLKRRFTLFLKMKYYYLRINLFYADFMNSLKTKDYENEAAKVCYQCALETARFAEECFPRDAPLNHFCYPVPTYINIYLAGIIFAMYQLVPGYETAFEKEYQICEYVVFRYAQVYRLIYHRLNALKAVKKNPMQELEKFKFDC